MAAQVTPNLVIFIKSASLSNCVANPVAGEMLEAQSDLLPTSVVALR